MAGKQICKLVLATLVSMSFLNCSTWSQDDLGLERPRVQPPRKLTPEEKARKEALILFGKATLLQHDNQLIEALKTFEEALRLDPETPAILRGLIPLYLAVDRPEDAFSACQRVLKLVPDDFATAYLYARHLRLRNRASEALSVLKTVAKLPGLKELPDLHVRVSYDRAQMLEEQKEWQAAIEAYRETAGILDEPGSLFLTDQCTPEEVDHLAAETYEHLGRIYLKRDEPRDASKAFEESRKRDPARAPRLALVMAEVMSTKGEWVETLNRVNEYLRSQPQGLDGYELKIKALRNLNRKDQILSELEQATANDRYNFGLKLLYARELRLAGHRDQAEKYCLELAQDRPTPEVYRELLTLYQEEGTAGGSRALDLLNLALEKGGRHGDLPGDPAAAGRARALLGALREDGKLARLLLRAIPARLQSGGSLATPTLLMFASLALRIRDLDLAERLYRNCLDHPDIVEAEVYGGLLRVLALAHKNQAVVEICRRGLKEGAKSNRAMFHLDLSQALMNLDQPREALAAGKAAVLEAGEAEDLLSRRNYVSLLSQAGKHSEAIAECEAMLKEYQQPGEQRDIRSSLAVAYLNAGDHAHSEAQLQHILESDPDDATTCNDLGYQWADQGKNLQEAERLIRKAIDLDHKQRRDAAWVGLEMDLENPAFLDSLGWVLFRKGQLKEARQQLERASQLPAGADDPVVWGHLGDVRKQQGDENGAEQAWQKGLRFYDNHQRRLDDQYRELKKKLHIPEK